MPDLDRFPASLGVVLVASLASACVFPMPVGDLPGSGTGTSGGSGGSTEADPSATAVVTTSTGDDGSSSSDGSSSDGPLDGTTGEQAQPCDACAPSDICVIDYDMKSCFDCDQGGTLPVSAVCVPELPEACNGVLAHTRACTLALCGNPHDIEQQCSCSVGGDYECAVGLPSTYPCDYWDPGSCRRCAPALDEQGQPLPYTECHGQAADAPAIGEPCVFDGPLVEFDPCGSAAYCDEVDPDTLTGVCRALCIGDVAAPTCAEAGHECVLFFAGQPQFGGVCRPV